MLVPVDASVHVVALEEDVLAGDCNDCATECVMVAVDAGVLAEFVEIVEVGEVVCAFRLLV